MARNVAGLVYLRRDRPSWTWLGQPLVTAELQLFKDFLRHTLRLLDGELLTEGIAQIIIDVQRGRSVLVCCNTVQRAQDMFTLLGSHLAPGPVELIHSRFIMRDPG